MLVSLQEQAKIVKPGDNALQFDAVYQKNGNGGMIFADRIEKNFLQIVAFIRSHDTPHIFSIL